MPEAGIQTMWSVWKRAVIQQQLSFHMDRPMVERGEKFICCFAPRTLDGSIEICKLRFSTMATLANPIEDPLQEFEYPQREAAFFYGLFLRGHSAEELRKDIQVPAMVLAKWDKETVRPPSCRWCRWPPKEAADYSATYPRPEPCAPPDGPRWL